MNQEEQKTAGMSKMALAFSVGAAMGGYLAREHINERIRAAKSRSLLMIAGFGVLGFAAGVAVGVVVWG